MKVSIIQWMLACLMIASGIMLTGCVTPGMPDDAYVDPSETGVISPDMDAKDYQMAAAELSRRLLTKGFPAGYRLSLGPVDTRRTTTSVDIEKLQDKLEIALSDNNAIQFVALRKAMTDGAALNDIMDKLVELNWEQMNSEDREWLAKFSKRVKIDGILYGRVSSIQRPISNVGIEVTYTFVWRVADLESGLVKAVVEFESRKRMRR